MKKVLSAAVISGLLIFSGCTMMNTDAGPTEVMESFADAIVKKDIIKAKQLCTPESQSVLNILTVAGLSSGVKFTDKFNKEKVEFGAAVIEGDNASVPVKDRASGQVINFPLRKIEGQWRVSVDMTSMQGMAKDKINTTTGGFRDSAKNVLRRINLDPLKNKINKILDSVKIEIP